MRNQTSANGRNPLLFPTFNYEFPFEHFKNSIENGKCHLDNYYEAETFPEKAAILHNTVIQLESLISNLEGFSVEFNAQLQALTTAIESYEPAILLMRDLAGTLSKATLNLANYESFKMEDE